MTADGPLSKEEVERTSFSHKDAAIGTGIFVAIVGAVVLCGVLAVTHPAVFLVLFILSLLGAFYYAIGKPHSRRDNGYGGS